MNKFWGKVFDILDDILAYILTVIGIVISAYIPLLKSTGVINLQIDWWRLGISAIVALIIIGRQEKLDADENGSKAKSKEGRKKNFGYRMTNALSQGMMWSQIISLASN
jgi:hypothetical protein